MNGGEMVRVPEAGNGSAEESGTDGVATLAAALSSPVRVRIVTHLLGEGPTSFGELLLALGISGPLLSNHLARLRKSHLVTVERDGRNAIYRLASPHMATVLQALHRAVDVPQPAVNLAVPQNDPAGGLPSLHEARSCYDHLAGRLGVSTYRWLLARHAVEPETRGSSDLQLGEGAEDALITLSVGMTALPPGRRRFAFACRDWTQKDDHLGGALGAAIMTSFVDRGWLIRLPDTRALHITPSGHSELEPLLGADGFGPNAPAGLRDR
ncbi:ArsR/SmtB family transcription factor [Nocardia sp. NPDC055053]